MAKAKTSTQRDADRKSAPKHPDAKLIAACVEYGFTMGGTNDAFAIDPTNDAVFVDGRDSENIARGHALLEKAAKRPSITIDGLAAKARTALMLLKERAGYVTDEEAPFLKSLAEDVVRLHSDVITPNDSLTVEPFVIIAALGGRQ